VPAQKQKIDPKLIQANTLLQYSGVELQQAVEQEILENPALELEDDNPCLGCELSGFGCKNCRYAHREETSQVQDTAEHGFKEFDYSFDPVSDSDDDEDPIGRLSAEVTLQEHLRQQLRNIASGNLCELGEYLINYINGSGYLECDSTELLLELDADDADIAEAVRLIQTLEPPGVGARDLRECLMIQLRYLADDGDGCPAAERIVSECWDEMAAKKLGTIVRRLKIKPDDVKNALDFIQTKLNPYPAAGFRVPWNFNPSDGSSTVRPDVVIHRTATGYEIEVVANEYPALSINPYYSEIYNSVRNKQPVRSHTKDELNHIAESVERADTFIRNLCQRRKTLRAIAKCIVEHQHGFLATGSKLFLRPLTRVQLAQILGVHESTVSRATAHKYVLLPSQELVEFDFFFHASQSAMDVIAGILSSEDAAHPMSDRDIADKLNERGLKISRRTVAKYRKALKILSSHRRRS
jgi:RNA polymerase sigma-54 factor